MGVSLIGRVGPPKLDLPSPELASKIVAAMERANFGHNGEPRGTPTTIKIWISITGPDGDSRRILALVDSGAEVSVILPEVLPKSCKLQKSNVFLKGAFNAN